MMLESMPPERNAPSGTSAISRRRTDAWSRSRRPRAAWSTVVGRSPACGRQNRRVSTGPPSSRQSLEVPDGTLVTARQPARQSGVVVDLAVVDHLDGIVLIGQRLAPAGGVHDAQARHAQGERALDPVALLVGTTVPE